MGVVLLPPLSLGLSQRRISGLLTLIFWFLRIFCAGFSHFDDTLGWCYSLPFVLNGMEGHSVAVCCLAGSPST